MQLANPLDDSTFTNENSVMSNWKIRVAGYDITQERWDKIFDKSSRRIKVQIMRETTRTHWVVLPTSQKA